MGVWPQGLFKIQPGSARRLLDRVSIPLHFLEIPKRSRSVGLESPSAGLAVRKRRSTRCTGIFRLLLLFGVSMGDAANRPSHWRCCAVG